MAAPATPPQPARNWATPVRWLLALAAAICGIVVIIQPAGRNLTPIIGLGLVFAAIAVCVP